MRKGWKIALISLGSLLGLVVIVVVAALYLIFTPARLTSIVNQLSKDFILCENHFESVDLTLFKTWPNVGLEVNEVVLINPYQQPDSCPLAAEASHNDTLLHVGSLTVGLDLKAFLSEGAVIVRQLRLDDTRANLYTAPDGWSNLDVFPKSDDTTASETQLPETIQLHKIAIRNLSAQYCDLQQRMLAQVDNLDLSIKGGWQQQAADADLRLDAARLMADMRDSLGNPSLQADVRNLALRLDAEGALSDLDGSLSLRLPEGDIRLAGTSYVTESMRQSRADLLSLSLPFHANWDDKHLTLKEAALELLDYKISLTGEVSLPHDEDPLSVDASFRTNTWQVADLLAVLPPFITQGLEGMDIDARLSLDGTAKGVVAEGRLPEVAAHVLLEKGSFEAPSLLPMAVKQIHADLQASLNLSSDSLHKGPSRVQINSFGAKASKSALSITGQVDDLLGDMLVDARVKGELQLPDIRRFLPDTMPLNMQGAADLNLKVRSRLSHITALHLNKVQADGTLGIRKLDVRLDSLHASSPSLRLALRLPAQSAVSLRTRAAALRTISAHITSGQLNVEMDNAGLAAQVYNPDIRVSLPNILDKHQPLAAAFDISFSRVNADLDSMTVYTDSLSLVGSVRNDTTAGRGLEGVAKMLKQWNPDVDVDLHRAVLAMSDMSEALRMPAFHFNYTPEVCEISEADIRWGVSDYHLAGQVYDVERWLEHDAMLRGDLHFTSHYADVDQLLDILSGMGSDPDTLAQQRAEDNVPKDANPFIVPKDVNVALHTNIDRCVVFGSDLDALSGGVTVNDGVAVLNQIGFTCKAARMQLTGMYKSPRPNHLFVGLDFHLLDIQIDELLDMIPSIDTLVPMLAAFSGKADFHLAAECNLNASYQPKMSTLLGAAAISGKDLVVLDNATLADIAKLLQLKNWREHDDHIGIDSLSVEATVFRKEIIVYPFLLNLHNYQLCIGGRHTLDNACNYHLELLKTPILLPQRLAVDVAGSLAKPKVTLGKVQYAELYKPEKRNDLQVRTLELKKMIREALEANVKK